METNTGSNEVEEAAHAHVADRARLMSRIRGTGEMADRIRQFTWSDTTLGSIERWPPCLAASVNLILAAPQPMQILWGPQMIAFYNDALIPSLAEKHPTALGGQGQQASSDAWPIVGEQLEDVLLRGRTHHLHNLSMPLLRGGVPVETRWSCSYSPLFDDDGSIVGVLNIAQDHTGEDAAQHARRETEEHLSLAMESAEIGTWCYDSATGIVVADERMRRIFGSPEGAGPVHSWLNLLHPDDRERVERHLADALQGKHPCDVEYRILRAHGLRWVRSKGGTTRTTSGRHQLFGIIEDVTPRKLEEEALRTSEKRLRESERVAARSEAQLKRMTDALPAFIAYVDRDYRYQRVNHTYEDWFERSADEIIGRTIDEVLGEHAAFEVRQHMSRALTGHPQHFEYNPVIRGEERILSVSHIPDLDENGRARGVIIQGNDITEQRRIQTALIQSEKLAAVGKLASSIAHEINNPLESVTNLLFLARSEHSLPKDKDEYLNIAERELRRVSMIATQTLRFHKQSTRPAPVAIPDLVGGVLSIFQGRLVNSHIEISKRERAPGTVECFEGEIRQVMNNLVGNAIDAMPIQGRLLLRTRDATNWRSGERGIIITVADTGPGMSKAVQTKIFDPFFTTKGIGGTGLGLWVSQEIVARHHGELRVRSRQGTDRSGSVFTLFLPCHAATRP